MLLLFGIVRGVARSAALVRGWGGVTDEFAEEGVAEIFAAEDGAGGTGGGEALGRVVNEDEGQDGEEDGESERGAVVFGFPGEEGNGRDDRNDDEEQVEGDDLEERRLEGLLGDPGGGGGVAAVDGGGGEDAEEREQAEPGAEMGARGLGSFVGAGGGAAGCGGGMSRHDGGHYIRRRHGVAQAPGRLPSGTLVRVVHYVNCRGRASRNNGAGMIGEVEVQGVRCRGGGATREKRRKPESAPPWGGSRAFLGGQTRRQMVAHLFPF